MKQSSIDWIYNNLKSHFEHDGDLLEAVKMSFKQAKEMHKEEMIEFIKDYGDFSYLDRIVEELYDKRFNTKEK